ncbi:MAG TPA: metalloregulator ArsR/SmtB family transcription factor [Thermoanaerobaculia bacterium]|nr:metalloregulator ArsR/SmtB family transcription factor [Thermoanaerobaculia bacterium]
MSSARESQPSPHGRSSSPRPTENGKGRSAPGAEELAEVDLDAVFHALAHPVRRQLLDLLRADPGCNVNDACRPFDLSRIAVMKHLRVLEDAGLVVSRKSGRSRELFFNLVPIQQVYERWTTEYSSTWAKRLLDLKRRVEGAVPADGGQPGPSLSKTHTEEAK